MLSVPHLLPDLPRLRRGRAVFAVLAFGLLAGTAGVWLRRRPEPLPAVAASWRGGQLTVDEATEAFRASLAESVSDDLPAGVPVDAVSGADPVEWRRAVLQSAVDQRLLVVEAQRLGLAVTVAEVQAAYEVAHTDTPVAGPPADPAAPTGPSPQEAERIRQRLLVDRLLVHEVVARTALKSGAVRAEYEARRSDWRLPPAARVWHLWLPRSGGSDVDVRSQIEALRRQLEREGDFSKLAREQSAGPEASRGGELGWVAPRTLPDAVDAVVWKIPLRTLSAVIASDHGFHLVRVEARREGRPLSFAEAGPEIERRLRRTLVAQAQADYIAALRQRMAVQLDVSLLSRPLP